MNKEEELFKRLKAFVAEHGEEYVDAEAAVDAFFQKMADEMEGTPSIFPNGKERNVARLFDELFYADSDQEFQKITEEILKLEPDNLDARFLALHPESPNFLPKLVQLVEEGEEKLKKEGWATEDSSDSNGWVGEARPLLRVKYGLAESYKQNRMKRKAVTVLEELLLWDPSDHIGARYDLLGLFCDLEEWDKAQALYQQYEERNAFMLLPLILLSLKRNDELSAKRYYKLLQENNKNCRAVFGRAQIDLDAWAEAIEEGFFDFGSKEEIYFAMEIVEEDFLLDMGDYYFNWLKKHLNKTAGTKKKIQKKK